MAEFNYLNYYSIYSCTGDVDHEMENDSCFHTVTKDDCKPFMDNKYIIRFYHDINYIRDNNNNNFCPFNIHELMAILGIIKSYRNFDFHVTDAYDTMRYIENIEDDGFDDNDGYDIQYKYYELEVHIKDSLIWHKFILKMIRSLYEYPFNMTMRDTLKLMDIEKFQQYGLFNIYMMIGYTLSMSDSIALCDDQFVCSKYNGIPKFIQRPALIKRMNYLQEKANDENYGKAVFNEIVTYSGNPSQIKDYFENRFTNTSDVKDYQKYWCDPEMFEERLDIYNEVLNYFIP